MKSSSSAIIAALLLIGALTDARADSPLSVGDSYSSSEGAQIEVSGIRTCRSSDLNALGTADFDLLEQSSHMSCSTRANIADFLTVNELTFEGIGVAAMCTAGGAPVGIATATLGLTLHLVDFIVRKLPCENPADDQKVKDLAKQTVCEVLVKKGFKCDPGSL